MREMIWDYIQKTQRTGNLQHAAVPIELSGARVLVLTGNPAWPDTIGRLLRKENLVFDFASSALLFDRMNKSLGKFDLIIMDIASGQWPSLELCRHIRNTYALFQLPVLFITDRRHAPSVADTLAAGGNDTLLVPFDEAEFRARVRQLLVMKSTVFEYVRAEMAFLHTRINSHFLFNTLNAVASLSEEDPLVMRMLLNRFGSFLHKTFRAENLNPLIPIHQEISLVESYLDIEKIRFNNRLQTELHIGEDVGNVLIPPLTIQSLVENAVRHGLTAHKHGGTLRVSALADGNMCRISVQDDGVGIARASAAWYKQRNSRSGSLPSIDRRLKLTYGTSLDIHSDPETGTRISFSIPLAGGCLHEGHID